MAENNDTPKKRCSKCGVEYPATAEYFYRSSKAPDGLNWWCKSCASVASRQWEHENKDRVANTKKKSRSKPENREKVSAYNREYSRLHHDEIQERVKQSRRKNPALHKTAQNKRRTQKRSLPVDFSPADWQECLNYWHGCCAYCGKQADGLWSSVNQEHFIPLDDTEHCPGTVRWNMLPACRRCNSGKRNRDPVEWVISRFGKRQGAAILKRIDEYFERGREP